jgi:hypothetical protein
MNCDPFFVVGIYRSGTTMLRLMLNEHSRLHVPPESFFLVDLMDRLPMNAPLNQSDLQVAFQTIAGHRRWAQWQIADDDLRAAIFSLREPSLSDLINNVFLLSCRRARKVRWGDKTPYYLEEIGRLHQLFPRAKFVHIIRDARDVCFSLRQVGWFGYHLHQIAGYWRRVVSAGVHVGRRLGPDLYLQIAYEDLVHRSEAVLRQICAFLGEAYEAEMLQFYTHAATTLTPTEKEFHVKTFRSPEPSDTDRWRREMNFMQVATVEAIAGSAMDLVGQARQFRGALRLWPLMLGAMIRLAAFTRSVRHRLRIKLPVPSPRVANQAKGDKLHV